MRSLSDVPNRVVRIFLEQAGRQYDTNRGLQPFSRLTADLRRRFDDRCAYCGEESSLIAEHLVPINRASVGLHSWGNVVPSCKQCNDAKAASVWKEHPRLDAVRRARLEGYISEMQYAPAIEGLRPVVEKLYELADRQTRALIEFGLVASQPHIDGLHAGASERTPLCG